MEKLKLDIKRNVLKEMVMKMEEAIPEDAMNDEVLDALCILLGRLFVATRESGMDSDIYFTIIKRKVSMAITAIDECLKNNY